MPLSGSDSVQIRSSRAAAVCLLLLCVFLLTAVIVLCVHVHTKNTNHREERHKLLIKNDNLTEKRDLLLTKGINCRRFSMKQVIFELQLSNMLLLKTSFIIHCTLGGNNELITELAVFTGGWFHSDFSFYFMSSMKKSWDESRRYCTERGADLIIINSREKQVSERYCVEFWIGVTDIVEEGTWKWVDGTSVTSGEPNGGKLENCAVTYLKKNPELIGWIDVNCNGAYQWICEKSSWF
uniref:C-type lectin domain-containing protein n=1 Tax=Cyprinus carpio carpio TaxID=630221 RepID=A0A8C1A941_CYPCA